MIKIESLRGENERSQSLGGGSSNRVEVQGASVKFSLIFNIPGVEEFKFYGSRVRATPPILSSIQAKRSIRQGTRAYLAYVTAKREVEKKLEDIPVVCDYPDVFAEVQSGVPPDREIEFTIDLMPGMEPIHRAPYRMASVELKELKEHKNKVEY